MHQADTVDPRPIMDALARVEWIGAMTRRAGAMASVDRRFNRRNIKTFFGAPSLDLDAEGAFNIFIVGTLMMASKFNDQLLEMNAIYFQISNIVQSTNKSNLMPGDI